MIQTHYIKLNQHYCHAVYCGDKNFEIRRNDRGYQKGDRVVFQAVDDAGLAITHEVNRVTYMITYVLNGYGLQDGFCVFGIKPWDDKMDEKQECGIETPNRCKSLQRTVTNRKRLTTKGGK